MKHYDYIEDESMAVTVETMPCPMCGEKSEIAVNVGPWEDYAYRGTLIQTAFPDMPAELREVFITGTHPECWEAMFADLDDE